ncbi:MAG TPA: radical SAM family heme chaperone HemW [Terracidiphilus sp.]|nr:radical SAM family heme chaperone HemW [Terracidiphilus sp.]
MRTAAAEKLGIYVSFPFCRSKCTYCNFASGVYPASEHGRYVRRLVEELRDAGAWAAGMSAALPRAVDSLYFGGGTPSLLDPAHVRELFVVLRGEYSVAKNAEITVECAPGQLSDATLEAFLEVGVNRISLGVQSFIDREARESGRLHTRAVVLADLKRLREAGIENVNIDLIAGLAGQTLASWQESLDVLLATGVSHASIYMLEVDEDSRLGSELLSGGARYHAGLVPSDDTIATMYETAVQRLESAGIAQYEISNFARAGRESRHNLRYWQRRPYLGIGLDASSMLRAEGSEAYVLRATTTGDLRAYLEASEPPETAWLSTERQQEEAWFLGLRLNGGVQLSAMRREFGGERVARALHAVERLEKRGLVSCDGKTVRLTALGRLLSNEAFQEFLTGGAGEEELPERSVAAT